MDAPPKTTSALRAPLAIFAKIVSTRTALFLLVLHFLSWSADSWVNGVFAILVLVIVAYYRGCGYIVILAYQAACYFSFLIRILEGVLRVIFIFALYEVVLELVGYHSEDYKKLKHMLQTASTKFTAANCMWFLNMTTEDGALILQTSDVLNLCNMTWYAWYVVMIYIGMYIGMPDYTRVKKDHFWRNLYMAAMLVVVWKALERFIWSGWWHSVEFQRTMCLYLHYIKNGEDGFKSTLFLGEHRQKSVPARTGE